MVDQRSYSTGYCASQSCSLLRDKIRFFQVLGMCSHGLGKKHTYMKTSMSPPQIADEKLNTNNSDYRTPWRMTRWPRFMRRCRCISPVFILHRPCIHPNTHARSNYKTPPKKNSLSSRRNRWQSHLSPLAHPRCVCHPAQDFVFFLFPFLSGVLYHFYLLGLTAGQ